MHVTVTTLDDRIVNVDVSEDLELENLKAQCEFELGIPSATIVLMLNGRPLEDGKKTLKDYGIKDGEVLLLQQMRQQSQASPQSQTGGMMQQMLDFSGIQIPGASGSTAPRVPAPNQQGQGLEDPKVIMDLLKNNPHERSLLKERNPPLSDALESGSEERFVDIYTRQRNERLAKDRERMRILQMNPFDPEAQRLIAEEIRLKNVESNMESAIEHVPESFGQVIMLYIDCRVNNHHVKAFVDSGAQMTIMSQECATRCNIMRLVDTRWAGIAKGVGTQKIIGRVHLGQIQIGEEFLPSSFSILENQPMDMLLGLDMLKRHQCKIDLKNNLLEIGSTGTTTSFLAENQLPAHARGNAPDESRSTTEHADRELAEVMQKSADEAAGGQSTSTANRSDQPSTSSTHTNSSACSAPSNFSNISQQQQQPPPQSGSSIPPGGASGAVARPYSEAVIQRLVTKGYSRHQVLEALSNCDGNEQKAEMELFSNMKW